MRMRFRTKFGVLGCAYVVLACFTVMLWLGGRHTETSHTETIGLFSITWAVLAFQKVLNQVQDFDSTSIHERRLWHERTVAWQEVNRVSAWNPKQPWSKFLAIHYARTSPMSDSGSIIANPRDRERFLSDLHRYAPQALFDV
jgi:hypothetical protein